MLVINKEARLHHIGQHVTLKPGVNDVPDEIWAACRKIETVLFHLDAGTFEEVKTKEDKPVEGLGGLPAPKAVALVKETFDLKLLSTWSETAKGPVAKAIAAQAELVKKKTEGKAQE